VVARQGGVRKLFPLDGKSEPEALKFVETSDSPVRFTLDRRAILVRRPPAEDGAVDVVSIDLTTGKRTPVRRVVPVPESINNGGVGQLLMTSDGAAYVQGYGVTQSDLYLVKGIR
ncbi:MAG: hypothetical protein ABIS06_09155, partial [Vicinamibacterales bacterium]